MRIVIEIHEISVGVHRACCSSLPGCIAFGYSVENARSKMADAVRSYLASFDVAYPERLDLETIVTSTESAGGRLNVFQESHVG